MSQTPMNPNVDVYAKKVNVKRDVWVVTNIE